ncbi:hypothetical protein [Bradyrhizobium sp. STM 3843]|uniref:hypothetical protein n=1 Tax=Bradyrhizobium sp. STM 3843 TaxID=551947 RepID=UPI0002F03438|nr:hypothetical protein [Bradyrhizobium sp. STM 3843]
MIQPVSSPQQMSPDVPPPRGTQVLGALAGLITVGLVVGALVLWARFGTTVFFETIVAGLEACF